MAFAHTKVINLIRVRLFSFSGPGILRLLEALGMACRRLTGRAHLDFLQELVLIATIRRLKLTLVRRLEARYTLPHRLTLCKQMVFLNLITTTALVRAVEH